MQTITINKITEGELCSISYRSDEVLIDIDLVQERWRELNRAATLGNVHKIKSIIQFESEEGELFELSTSVWSVTAKYVILKKGMLIPIHSIHRVIT